MHYKGFKSKNKLFGGGNSKRIFLLSIHSYNIFLGGGGGGKVAGEAGGLV